MKFRTELNKPKEHEIVDYSKKVLCVGSCFAEHLHFYLQRRKYMSFLNPCGISYNPFSIRANVEYALGYLSVQPSEFQKHDGVYSHPYFHSSFSARSRELAYENIRAHLEEAKEFSMPDVVILSLGTAFAYHTAHTDLIVNNCHKLPSSNFVKKLMSVEEIVDLYEDLILILKDKNPLVKIIGTVSPVRHLRDGMVENNRSKSILNVALQHFDEIMYFPSYELLLDDLRDYRFYDRDLVHPSEEAVEYIMNSFEGQFLSKEEAPVRKQILQVHKDLEHRAFLPESDEHQGFLMKLIHKMESMELEYRVDFDKELELTKSRLV